MSSIQHQSTRTCWVPHFCKGDASADCWDQIKRHFPPGTWCMEAKKVKRATWWPVGRRCCYFN